ncbi:hypothetical protein DBR32_08020 [Taibaiella sp. KBW10]|uniref:hypothetical protein n=1 Tax=Taibaiella sp. KBW10 TaxID=2153357 RepID=UPI000F5A4231|nr:hypothetical protein [Taibaiella sp. KBW10]RQO30669.1 hypothetical protein DBR32_08020 [Taibaiella sp. KBW10]
MKAAFLGFAKQVEQSTGLSFFENPGVDNLCFATNPELRAVYKSYFTTADLWHYIFALMPGVNEEQLEFASIPLPENADAFWCFLHE